MPETPHPAPIQRVVDAAARKGVTLDVHVFAESTHTAEEAARAVDAELGQIVKSLVFVAPGADGSLEPVICLVSGPNRVDLARLAAVAAEPDVRRANANEARELTGYTIGGIPPIGHPGPVRVIMDPDLGRFPVVWAAAGTPTAVFPVPPATLRMLVQRPRRPDLRGAAGRGRPRRALRPGRGGAGRRLAGHDAEDRRGRRLTTPVAHVAGEPRHTVIAFPGGLRASLRWAGSGRAAEVFALTEAGGPLVDLGELAGPDPDERCRAEIRRRDAGRAVDGPARLDDQRRAGGPAVGLRGPARHQVRVPRLRVRRADRRAGAGATGARRRCSSSSARPGCRTSSPRPRSRPSRSRRDGEVAWRVAHSDVVTEAELVGGRLVLTSFDGQVRAIDPLTGRSAG